MAKQLWLGVERGRLAVQGILSGAVPPPRVPTPCLLSIAYRFDVDDTVALAIHHIAQQLLQPRQLDAVSYRLPPVSHTQHKCHPILERPHLYIQDTYALGEHEHIKVVDTCAMQTCDCIHVIKLDAGYT